MISKFVIVLFLILVSSCIKTNIDESFIKNHRNKSLYVTAIKEVKRYFNSYNDTLETKIHEKFWKDFYFSYKNHFNIDIIFSKVNVALVYIEKNDSKANSYYVYHTDKNPQIFIQEIKNRIKISDKIPPSYPWYISPGEGPAFMTGGNFTGSPILVGVNKNSFLAWYNYTITLVNPDKKSITTNLSGMSILVGANDLRNFNNHFDISAQRMLSHEITDQFTNSDIFRKALVHPKLKELAIQISEKKAKAINKVKEYPLWELEEDINKMKILANENFIDASYVDEMFKDPQYYPTSGKLIFYYSNEFQFMLQWACLNLFFVIIVLLLRNKLITKKLLVKIPYSIIFLSINGWIFYTKPDVIGIIYWIIPGLFLLTSYLLLFINNQRGIIKNSTEVENKN